MNVRLLRRIQRIILKRPTQIDMRAWFYQSEFTESGLEVGHCGTTACIAGWAITFDKIGSPNPKAALRKQGNVPRRTAEKALKLDDIQSERLFYEDYWPARFTTQLDRHAIGSLGYAKTVAARIGHFIKTKGAE